MRKEDYIIVTKDYPGEVVEGLINEGYIYVESYEKVAREVYVSMPEKTSVQRFYSAGEKGV